MQMLLFLVPMKSYLDFSAYVIGVFHLVLFLLFFTDKGSQMVFHTFILAIIYYFILGESYQRGLDFGSVLSHTIMLVLFFILCSSMAMVVAYISELHSKMATTITENL